MATTAEEVRESLESFATSCNENERLKAMIKDWNRVMHIRATDLKSDADLTLTTKNGDQMTLLSPVVRCYRTYSVEFKTDAAGNLLRENRLDKDGVTHSVPQIFDLTPDI